MAYLLDNYGSHNHNWFLHHFRPFWFARFYFAHQLYSASSQAFVRIPSTKKCISVVPISSKILRILLKQKKCMGVYVCVRVCVCVAVWIFFTAFLFCQVFEDEYIIIYIKRVRIQVNKFCQKANIKSGFKALYSRSLFIYVSVFFFPIYSMSWVYRKKK